MNVGETSLPDEAFVVRCGRPPTGDPTALQARCVEYAGWFGFSVQAAEGVSIVELARWCPNRRIGITTVGEIRKLGYDVVVTPGRGHHATVVVPRVWTVEESAHLIALFREEKNPSQREAP